MLITLSGDGSDSQVLNDGESCRFLGDTGGNYTLTPSKSGVIFDPSDHTFSNLNTDGSQDFSAVPVHDQGQI